LRVVRAGRLLGTCVAVGALCGSAPRALAANDPAPFPAAPTAPTAGTDPANLAPAASAPTNEALAAENRQLSARMREFELQMQQLRAQVAGMQQQQQQQQQPQSASAASAPNYDYQPKVVPFSFGDFSWAPGGYAPLDSPLAWGPFHGEFRVDVAYHHSFANPVDDTISGSSEVFRSGEFQLTQLGIGGDFYYKGAHGRLMTQFGMYSETTPRNDPSPARGQWNLADALRYISEAYGGYHWNVLGGLNVQAGIFMSYVGLWSYYNFDNWTYQPSYVSSNTPWFFNGMRIQFYPTDRLKIEPWLVNGWQAYGKFNEAPGVGLQVRWNPREWLSVLGNQYYGTDTLGTPDRRRIHTDDSIMVRFYNAPESRFLSKAAASFTFDAGCEFGGTSPTATDPNHQVTCSTQYFVGFMAYARLWFFRDIFGVTFGGGAITNPGRYLVLTPPVNGATAYSGTPFFPQSPGDPTRVRRAVLRRPRRRHPVER
jgi:hypothetical protein